MVGAALLAPVAAAQQAIIPLPRTLALNEADRTSGPVRQPTLPTPVVLPRMAPELALAAYEQRLQRQVADLGGCTDTVLIRAELPDTSQKGEFELKRYFAAPKSLSFGALRFVGDKFVKTNVIVRLLQSEVDHVEKGIGGDISISARNYKFNYKGTEILDGKSVHVYQLKPRQKRVGLFKGRIFVDAYTGSLRRAEGTFVRSPSVFIKKVEFVQDYADFGDFTFPVHIHSNAKTRLIGRAVIDIFHRDYEARAVSNDGQPAATPAAVPGVY